MEQEIKNIKYDEKNFPFKIKNNIKIKELNFLGDITLTNKKTLGIVGPRKPTEYGKLVIKKLFQKLNKFNVVIVSGFAKGIDSLAHQLAIKNGLNTIAILGGGIDYFLNSNKRHIIKEILSNKGLIISQFENNFEPTFYSFPMRNKIIAAVSDIIFIPEASENSGSLITAEYAIKFNKRIFVTPNCIFKENSKGIIKLLIDKKAYITDEEFSFLKKFYTAKHCSNLSQENNLNLTKNQKLILETLKQKGELSLEELKIYTKLNSQQILSELTILEINGILINFNGKYMINK